MKSSKAIVQKRQQTILQILTEKIHVSTENLAGELGVSNLTIRRDLQELAGQGFVRVVRGGANLVNGTLYDDPSSENESMSQDSKLAIARHAASLVENGDTILINSSTTAIQILPFIKDKKVIVVTNNGLALSMTLAPGIELIFTGGEVRGNKKSMVGEVAVNNLSRIRASKAFIGVSGISARGGIFTSILQETAINESMIRRSAQCLILADGSKIGQQNNFQIGSARDASVLVTDDSADPSAIYQLQELGVKVYQVQIKSQG
ncbi:MAG: DeoR/GlpR transcriptional regulator [Clostridia bacterium]|nr:DeoR/GlpR transcriptional regulator [Clostridia bacterium]NCC75471.1 DeoR/GlpR transcriptional regulator [Clostridia bacterium]